MLSIETSFLPHSFTITSSPLCSGSLPTFPLEVFPSKFSYTSNPIILSADWRILILWLRVWVSKDSLDRTFENKRETEEGLPWWRSGWESACQCRGHGFELWSGKIPHAAEQLGPWATTTEPAHLELVLCNKRGRDSERPAHRNEEWPPLAATRESPRTETKTQHSQK